MDWRSQEALWRVTLDQNPGAAVGWTLLGDVEASSGRAAEAERCYRRAIEVRDGAGFFYPEAHNKLAALLVKRDERAEAESHYQFVVVRRPQQYVALCNLGEMLLRDPDAAPKPSTCSAAPRRPSPPSSPRVSTSHKPSSSPVASPRASSPSRPLFRFTPPTRSSGN
jgi:tetratricopeptide (TPR) repeat protein